jgi:non-ribosomal peptide synthetase component F
VLPADVVERLHAKARERGTTLFVLLLAAYTAMLQRLGGQKDMVVGTPVRGREQAELLPVMGFFVNALPLRFRGDASSFEDWIGQVTAPVLGDEYHTHYVENPDIPHQIDLIQIMRDGRLHTAAELAANVGVSVRTIWRDMAMMARTGLPVEGSAVIPWK